VRTRTNATRTAFLVGGLFAASVGLGSGIAGGALVWAHSTQRDSAGFYSTSAERLTTSSFAMTSPDLDFGTNGNEARWVPGSGGLTALVEATGAGDRPVFVGIARKADVDRYLAGSAHDEITDFDVDPFRAEYRRSPGDARPAAPAVQTFWLASAHGDGLQRVTAPMKDDDLTVVVMNGDGSAGVTADVAVGAKTGLLLPVGLGLLALAAVSLGLGATGIVLGGAGGPARPRPAGTGTGNAQAPGTTEPDMAGVTSR
jgi:hypothetical protein